MFKKELTIFLAALLLFVPAAVFGESVFYGSGLVTFGEPVGAGYSVRYGQEFSRYIGWAEWEETTNYNDGEERNANVGQVGFTVLTDKFLHLGVDLGMFFTLRGGAGNEEGEKLRFSKGAAGGLFFEPSDFTRIYAGAGVSGVKRMYPKVEVGFSLKVDFDL